MLGVIRAAAVLVCLYALVAPVKAQQPVDPKNMYERVLAIVPLAGSGTAVRPSKHLKINEENPYRRRARGGPSGCNENCRATGNRFW